METVCVLVLARKYEAHESVNQEEVIFVSEVYLAIFVSGGPGNILLMGLVLLLLG